MKPLTSPGAGSSAPSPNLQSGISLAASWILGFGLVVFASASDGAFGIDVFGQVGTFAWLLLALGLLLALFPVDRPGPDGLVGVGLWLGLAAWAALGLLWTDSPDKTWVEVARLLTYAGVFCLALASRGRENLPSQLGSVAAGITSIAGLALLSRFQPDLFPSAFDTGKTLTSEAARLSFPLDYWNGLAALVAIGLPILVEIAGGSRRTVFRALATAAIPISILTIYFTFSRGGIIAATVAVLIYFCLTGGQLQRLIPAILGTFGGAILVLVAKSKPALREGLTDSSAHSQGDTVMLITIAVCLLTGLAAYLLLRRFGEASYPARLKPSRKATLIAGGTLAALVLVVALAAGAPGRVSSGWESFKSSDAPAHGSARLEAANGNGRYQYWSSAVKQWKTAPLAGEGAGTFEFWWAENGDRPGFIRDTHSLYFQTLGESGLIGFALLLSLFGLVLVVGVKGSRLRVLGRECSRSGWLAAATAGCVAFMISAGLDWSWQLPAVVVPFLLLAATILGQSGDGNAPLRVRWRIALGLLPLVAVAFIAIPLSSSLTLQNSQDKAADGDLVGALDQARDAHSISPSTAAPLLQEAGLLEELGEPEAAIEAAREATEKEPVNWRNWLVLAGIETRHGDVEQGLSDFREARRLNPRSQIFAQGNTE